MSELSVTRPGREAIASLRSLCAATTARPLFLRWLVLQACAVAFFAGFGAAYGGRVSGPSLVAIPVILSVFALASLYAGRLCWRGDSAPSTPARQAILHDAEWVSFSSWLCQVAGIMATVFGVWELTQSQGDATVLVARIRSGLGVALMGTFVGIACSVVLEKEKRWIEAMLGR